MQTPGTPVQPWSHQGWNQFLDIIAKREVDVEVISEPYVKSDGSYHKICNYSVVGVGRSVVYLKTGIDHKVYTKV